MKLFTKTWHQDLFWLKWAFKSVFKFCDEPVVWHVVAENNICDRIRVIADECTKTTPSKHQHQVIVHNLDTWPDVAKIKDDYMGQQWIKMMAHLVVGDELNDIVWNWDSDVLAQRPFKQSDFLGKSGLPIYWFSELDRFKGSNDYGVLRLRADLVESIFDGAKVTREWMRCMPIPLNGRILKEGSRSSMWPKAYKECVAGNRALSEFNVIGQFAYLYFNGSFDWKNADTEGPTWGGPCGSSSFVCQHWSWGGETQEFKNWAIKEFGSV